jgi:hypothetical protein
LKTIEGILGRVYPTRQAQHLVIQGLDTQADAGCSCLPEDTSLAAVQGARVGFHRDLGAHRQHEDLKDLLQQPAEVEGGETCGGPTPEVGGKDRAFSLAVPGFLDESIKVRFYQVRA